MHFTIKILENHSTVPDNEILQEVENNLKNNKILYTLFHIGYYLIQDFQFESRWLNNKTLDDILIELSRNFSGVCFTKNVYLTNGEYRILYFEGKTLEQKPEIIYPQFHLNTFMYDTSDKLTLVQK